MPTYRIREADYETELDQYRRRREIVTNTERTGDGDLIVTTIATEKVELR